MGGCGGHRQHRAGCPAPCRNPNASGTEIIEALEPGADALDATGNLCRVAADSVLSARRARVPSRGLRPLASHDLLQVDAVGRRLVDLLNIGRVIGRPFSAVSTAAPPARSRTDCGRSATGPRHSSAGLASPVRPHGQLALGKTGDISSRRTHSASRRPRTPDGNDAMTGPILWPHISRCPTRGLCFVDRDGLRQCHLKLPFLERLGLCGLPRAASTGRLPPGRRDNPSRPASGGMPSRRRRARTRRPATGRSPACPCRSPGAISRRPCRPFPGTDRRADRRRRRARHPRQLPRLRHADHRRARRGAHPHRQADLLHLGRLASSRSPRTRHFRPRAALCAVRRSRSG